MILMTLALAAATATATGEPADPKQKIRCVREEMIGSLVRTRKVCHTIAEWEAVSRANAENTRNVLPDTNISQSNGSGG